jgi:3-oxoacyl-[acyl-carrier-protein] synthase II
MSRPRTLGGCREVVVSGLGVVSPYGAGAKCFWSGLAAGTCTIKPITIIETEGFRSRIAAEIPVDVMNTLGSSWRRSRADRIALAAAREALADSGLEGREQAEAALLVGAVGGGMLEGEHWYWAQTLGDGRSSRRSALRSILPFSHADTLGWRLGLTGPKETVVMACASGAASIALGADLVRAGVTPTALVGGVDALTHTGFMGFNALKLLDPSPCRPFDRDRRGMSLGEAAAFLVVEDAEHCQARGGRVYARFAGYGMSTDAHHVTAPHPEGMIHAMRLALNDARLPATAVGYVNAHGTGTPQNDRVEARALREVFGEGGVLVSSTKSLIGHTMAGAGSVEAAATILALQHELLPPTANLEAVDPEVAFDCLPGTARPARISAALSNSFGFGGQNVTLIFARDGS